MWRDHLEGHTVDTPVDDLVKVPADSQPQLADMVAKTAHLLSAQVVKSSQT